MGDAIDRLITALWETIVFCGPLWFAFVAILIAVCGRFCFLTFRDEREERLAEDVARGVSNSRRDDTSTTPATPPRETDVFDQDQLPAWMPTAPEAWATYRKFHRGHRQRRAAARRSVA